MIGHRALAVALVLGGQQAVAGQDLGIERELQAVNLPAWLAVRSQLDVTLPATLTVNSADEATGNPFAEAVFAAPGVAAIFGVNDFVTVTRSAGADWGPIVEAVQQAAASHL